MIYLPWRKFSSSFEKFRKTVFFSNTIEFFRFEAIYFLISYFQFAYKMIIIVMQIFRPDRTYGNYAIAYLPIFCP